MKFLILFFLIIIVLYSYLIYPLLLLFMMMFLPRSCERSSKLIESDYPTVSMIVTVFNEEQRIRQKLENTKAIEYPTDKIEILIASDCSTDNTEQIVREYQDDQLRLVRANERLGKENAQRCAIEEAQNEILIFSDVATQLERDAIQKLIQYYRDPEVGAVSSEDRFISQSGVLVGEGIYVQYEMFLRKLESSLAGLIGLSGSFFSCRKTIAENWDIQSPSDFNTALNCARAGKRAVTAPDVLGYYKDLKDPAKEYQRKVRTVLRGMTGLTRHRSVLNPFKFGLFSFQLISHKLMRWLVPVVMLIIMILNILWVGEGVGFALLMLMQTLFYGLCIAAHYNQDLLNNSVIRICYFFIRVNVAIFHSIVLFLSGKKMTVWNPSER